MIEAVEVVIRQPGHPDRVVRLQEGATRLGRAEDNELVLSDVGVSRRHAQIAVARGEVTIEDLGSGNGTYYNGYRIQSQPIQNGDEIVIDPFVLQFRILGLERAIPLTSDAPDQAPARLEVVVGTGMAGSSYPIAVRGLTIGRSEDRDVVIPDPAASRHHCSILVQGDAYVLRDMGSANGVYVNAVRVRECTLSDGDLVRIGNTEMRFVRYDQAVSDTTTQVVPHEVWNAGAGDPAWAPQPDPPRESSARGGGGLVGVVLGLGIVAFALGVAAVVVVVAAVLWFSAEPALPAIPPRAPAWHLQLPPGLPSAPTSALFDAGVEKMRDGDRRGAVQDFYRVLSTDPDDRSAERFAFAAGELLVLDALEPELQRRVAHRSAREAERDRLLRDAKRAGRAGRVARAALDERFRDDPVVVEAMGWAKSEARLALEATLRQAHDLRAARDHAQAAARYQEVLDGSDDPVLRDTAAAGLAASRRELARAQAGTWTDAVMSEALGNAPHAAQRFEELASSDPANASHRLHLARLDVSERSSLR